MKARQVTGSPRFCWVCSKKLLNAPGKGKGLYYCQIVHAKDGHDHRVHSDCVKFAVADGAKLIKEEEQG